MQDSVTGCIQVLIGMISNSASSEANSETIIISSDEDLIDVPGGIDQGDVKGPVVLAILPPEKRVFTPTKTHRSSSTVVSSDSDSEVDKRYIHPCVIC